jgi:eukaryotic-like serine/threonine-protein kinase
MRPDYPSLVGTLIADKYRIDRLLGQGGMGLVYAATHLDLARAVAVKLIRRELMETESVAERFLLEARAAARIQSEHVGRVLDVGRLTTGEPYIVMEFLEGQDLAAHLEQFGPFAWHVAVDLILEACEAIAEAHHHQIVHRDLKPENLFLVKQVDGSLLVKVLDFGISKQLGDNQRVLTKPSTAIGSPQYMAPEQMEGQDIDVRADVWALGAILYEMVTGKRAFTGETLAQVCVQVLSGNFTPVCSLAPEVPVALAVAIETCLRPPRAERFSSVAGFASAIAPFGSERARLSTQRVHAVLGYTVQQSTGTAQWKGPGFEGTQIQATKDNRDVAAPTVPTPAGLAHVLPGSSSLATDGAVPASSHTVGLPRKRSLIPVFAGLATVVAIGVFLWEFTRRYAAEEQARVKAAADLAAAYSAANVGVQPPPTALNSALNTALVIATTEVVVTSSAENAPAAAASAAEPVVSVSERGVAASDDQAPIPGVAPKLEPSSKPSALRPAKGPNKPMTTPERAPATAKPLSSALDTGFGGRK